MPKDVGGPRDLKVIMDRKFGPVGGCYQAHRRVQRLTRFPPKKFRHRHLDSYPSGTRLPVAADS